METFYHGFVVIIPLSLVLPSHCCYNLLTENRFLVEGTLGDPRLISKSYKATTRLSSTQDYVAAVFSPTDDLFFSAPHQSLTVGQKFEYKDD